MKNILFSIGMLLFSCTTYPKFNYEAIDQKGKILSVYEYKGSYIEPQHSVGDTVVIHTNHGNFGQISELEFDGNGYTIGFKNVIIIKHK